MSSTPTAAEVLQVGFKTLKLRPGMLLQAQPVVTTPPNPNTQHIVKDVPRYDAQFLGIIEGKGIMIVPHGVLSLKHGMQAGEDFVIRGFTGRYDFSFASQVIRIYDYSYRDPPLAYALLTYPETVEARQVRRALRVPTSIPAVVSPFGENQPTAVTMQDLSVAGSLVISPLSLGAVGDKLTLAFSVEFEGEKVDLAVPATICRSVKSNAEGGYQTGFLFTDISRNDKLMLYYFVYSSTE